jgi:hypothetical protein
MDREAYLGEMTANGKSPLGAKMLKVMNIVGLRKNSQIKGVDLLHLSMERDLN